MVIRSDYCLKCRNINVARIFVNFSHDCKEIFTRLCKSAGALDYGVNQIIKMSYSPTNRKFHRLYRE